MEILDVLKGIVFLIAAGSITLFLIFVPFMGLEKIKEKLKVKEDSFLYYVFGYIWFISMALSFYFVFDTGWFASLFS